MNAAAMSPELRRSCDLIAESFAAQTRPIVEEAQRWARAECDRFAAQIRAIAAAHFGPAPAAEPVDVVQSVTVALPVTVALECRKCHRVKAARTGSTFVSQHKGRRIRAGNPDFFEVVCDDCGTVTTYH